MSTIKDYRGHGISIQTADITTQQHLGGLVSSVLENRPNVVQEQSADSVYPNAVYVAGFDQMLRYVTTNIKEYFDIFGTTIQCIKGTTVTHAGFDFWGALWDECSAGPASGSVHRRHNLAVDATDANLSTGLHYPETLTVDHRGNARMAAALAYKGTNAGGNRLTVSNNNALPAGVVDSQNRFTLAKATIGGQTFTGKRNLSINFNAAILKEAADSNLYPDKISLNGYAPLITIDGIDPTWLDSIAPIGGKGITHANTSLWLQKRDSSSGGYVDAGTAEHIKITTAGVLVPTNMLTSQISQVSTNAVSIFTKFDGTNVPILVSTDQAIT